MSDREHIVLLLDEIDEEIETTGYVGLYDFSWALRGLELGLDEAAVIATAGAAYEEFRRQRPTKLVWLTWPPDLDNAVDADEGTVTLNFDLGADRPRDAPFLALLAVDEGQPRATR